MICQKSSGRRRFITLVIGTALLSIASSSLLLACYNKLFPREHVSFDKREQFDTAKLFHPRVMINQLESTSNLTKKEIEVSNPYVPKPRYGSSIFSLQLVDHYFAQSYGTPYVGSYSPPKGIEFNRVVATLNTSVSGVQFDRLAHLYIGGVELWRTSTIEPGGMQASSSFKKDLSKFSNLLHQNNTVIFELNNNVDSYYTGIFHIQISLDFYYEPESHVPDYSPAGVFRPLYSSSRPADKVIPLTVSGDPSRSPEKTLPQDKVSAYLPRVSQNTTRLVLSVTTSGNADEEFWYTNVLDSYTNFFGNQSLLGHGPARFVNIYINGKKVGIQAPEPVIFTGGISPSFWSAVVCTDAFDLPSYDFDVTGLLPLLWEQGINSTTLPSPVNFSVEITNGLTDVGRQNYPYIGNGWITTATLFTYESELVSSVSGSLLSINDDMKASTIVSSVPQTLLNQIVDTKGWASYSSNLKFNLKNGIQFDTIIDLVTNSSTLNIQVYTNKGNNENLVHRGASSETFQINDKVTGESLFQTTKNYNYPLVLTLKDESENLNEQVADNSIAKAKVVSIDVDQETKLTVNTKQNGTSVFTIAPGGNYGSGNLTTTYKLDGYSPYGPLNYYRKVDAVNSTIVSDNEEGLSGSDMSYEIVQNIKQILEDNFKDIGLDLGSVLTNQGGLNDNQKQQVFINGAS